MEQLADQPTEPRRKFLKRRPGYSRYVYFMKFALPMAALILIAMVVIWPQIKASNVGFNIGFARLKIGAPENPSMVNARFVGSDKRDQPFSITADLAKNLMLGKSAIELEMPKADIGMKDGSWIVLTANSGIYDQKGKMLNLRGAVNMFHDSGYEFKTQAAQVDLETGVAQGSHAIAGQGPFGRLEAEGFRIENKGQRMIFTGKAKLVINPQAVKGAK